VGEQPKPVDSHRHAGRRAGGRGIDASEGRLSSEAEGEIYLDDKREAAERSHAFHASRCPVTRSTENAIEITTELQFA
jgi:hypothetical protein